MAKKNKMWDKITERYENEKFLKVPGLDEAIIGIGEDFNAPKRLIYSVKKCIEILTKQMEVKESELEEGETIEEKKYEYALEHFEFNIRGAYVGEQTPIWCENDF